MREEEFIKLAKKKSKQIYKQELDKKFIEMLTYTRIFLATMFFYKRYHLSEDDKIDFGIYSDLKQAFENIDRRELVTWYIYSLINMTFDLDNSLLKNAFDAAYKAYVNCCRYPDAEDNARYFEKSATNMIEKVKVKRDTEKFFNLYQSIATKFFLGKAEKKDIKDAIKRFDELLIFDPKNLIETYKNEIEAAKKEMQCTTK